MAGESPVAQMIDTDSESSRVPWVDVAKGLCIVMVVAMHSTLGVEKAIGREGWMAEFVSFARPFRMPDFFMISGLFLAMTIGKPWRRYIDRKVVHFLYFYVLWVAIQAVVKSAGATAAGDLFAIPRALAEAVTSPPGTLWFIYVLPIFFVMTRLLNPLPAPVVLGFGAFLEILFAWMQQRGVSTPSFVVDEMMARYVYFLFGYYAAPMIFALAEKVRAHRGVAIAALAVWALANYGAVQSGLAVAPFASLVFGLLGAGAVITIAALITTIPLGQVFRYMGERSIVIYLGFFLGMAATRTVLIKTGVIQDVGTISLIVTIVAVVVPLVMAILVKKTPLAFLFTRPEWAKIDRVARAERPASPSLTTASPTH